MSHQILGAIWIEDALSLRNVYLHGLRDGSELPWLNLIFQEKNYLTQCCLTAHLLPLMISRHIQKFRFFVPYHGRLKRRTAKLINNPKKNSAIKRACWSDKVGHSEGRLRLFLVGMRHKKNRDTAINLSRWGRSLWPTKYKSQITEFRIIFESFVRWCDKMKNANRTELAKVFCRGAKRQNNIRVLSPTFTTTNHSLHRT